MIANQELIQAIAREVLARIEERLSLPTMAAGAGEDGVFETVDQAVKAAAAAQPRVASMGLEERERMNAIIRRICHDNADELARIELAETKIGRADHKAVKLRNIRYVLGTAAMRSDASSDSPGLCLIEYAPWGVIGMVLPATHSVPTMASNAINILAAGNTAVFSPHPAGVKVAARGLQMFNREIQRELGVANVLTMAREATIQNAELIFQHPDIALICATGGPPGGQAATEEGRAGTLRAALPICQRAHHGPRGDHSERGADFSASRYRADLRHRRARGGAGGHEVRQACDRGGSGKSARGGGRNRRSGRGGKGDHPGRILRQQPLVYRRKRGVRGSLCGRRVPGKHAARGSCPAGRPGHRGPDQRRLHVYGR